MGAVGPIRFSPSVSLHSECPHCGLLSWCLSANLKSPAAKRLNDLVTHQQKIKRGKFLHYAGKALASLYVVRTGFLKTFLRCDNGHEQLTGFSMTGDLIGMDAIGTGKHLCNTVALEDSTLCGIRYVDFEDLSRTVPALQHHFHCLMSAEIARDEELMFVLGSMHAPERTAAFLLSMSKRFVARGYSGTHFMLPMTRQEIASYLGLKLETVSRAFSDFKHHGIIAIKGKDIEIRNLARLQQALETIYPPRGTRNIGNARFGSLAVSINVS